jgi:hypothetical protein
VSRFHVEETRPLDSPAAPAPAIAVYHGRYGVIEAGDEVTR